MHIPKFLYGTHIAVTRACGHVADAIVLKQRSFQEVEGDFLDTAVLSDVPILFRPPSTDRTRECFLLYPLIEAMWTRHVKVMREDAAVCRRIVADALKREWSTLTLVPNPNGQMTVIRHGMAIEFLRAIDLMWGDLEALGPRFHQHDAFWFSEDAQLVASALASFGVTNDQLPYRPSMKVMRKLVTQVVRSHESPVQ